MSLLREILDWIYITRARALEMGFDHEGTHFGVPIWCRPIGSDGMDVAAKSGPLEWVIDLGVMALNFRNAYCAPGDELEFAFLIKPIENP